MLDIVSSVALYIILGGRGSEVPQILPVGLLRPLPSGSLLLHTKILVEDLRGWKNPAFSSRIAGNTFLFHQK